MGPEECDFKENILYCEFLRGNLCLWQPLCDADRDLCCGAVACGPMGTRRGCELGAGLGWAQGALVPSPAAGVPVPLAPLSCMAFGGGQATSLRERGSEAQPGPESRAASVRFPQ